MASASAGALAGATTDLLRLRPRLLLALLDDCLPRPDADEGAPPRPADLAYAADAVRAHGLLAEHEADGDPSLREEWRAAVDAWVGRLLGLMDSDREHGCWLGTSFLGLTFQECSDDRFLKSYSDWFQKVLGKMKLKNGIHTSNLLAILSKFHTFLNNTTRDVLWKFGQNIVVVGETSILSTFSKLKDEATSLAKKVIKPLLLLLDENGPVTEKAADLLSLLMKLFPSSVYRHFNKVESVITAKIVSGHCNLQQSKKLASTLALLPCVRISKNGKSLMIQKILTVVNNMLNGAFHGLEEGQPAPPGTELVPPLGGQTIYEDRHILLTTESPAYVVSIISALIHCCSEMLTSSYPIQVTNIPVHALVTLIQKVLSIDGSLLNSLFQSNTPFYQELISFEIPKLHSIFLDLLVSTVKGMRSSLIPHAGILITLIPEYFKRAKLPSIRTKLYTAVRLLLSSMGVGILMQLLQVVISNIFADLDDKSGSSLSAACTDPGSEPTCNRQMMAPLCVKIGALETMEVLLNVGGSFKAYSWRTEMDLLLIDVARNAYYKAGTYEQKPLWTEDSSISHFQLASFKTLLASFLSNPHERPLYLEQGLELFHQGKLEAGTELGNFCSHALLTLDVLIHPRQLPPHRGSYSDIGIEQSVPGSQATCSVRKRQATDGLEDECNHRPVSFVEERTDGLAKRIAFDKHTPLELPRVRKDASWSHDIEGRHPEVDVCWFPTEGVQAIPVLGASRTDVEMTDQSFGNPAALDTLGDPANSFSIYPALPTSNSRNIEFEISNMKSGYQGSIPPNDASSSQNVEPAHTCPIFAAASASGSEWDSVDPLLDLSDINFDSRHGW